MSTMPLYLQHGSARRLDLDPVRRLLIERRDLPERRIPLHHVSRIVCGSSLDISSRVLMACLQSGIPLTVVAPDGAALGWCMGARRTETTLRHLLTHALDDPAWPKLYGQWLGLQRLATAVQNLLLCGVPTTPQARRNPRSALCNAHALKHRRPCGEWVKALAQLAHHELAAHLARETGAPELLAWYRPGLNLIDDLGGLLGLHAHTDVHHIGFGPAPDQLTPWAIRIYERHARHWQQRMAHLMVAFEQFLRSHWL